MGKGRADSANCTLVTSHSCPTLFLSEFQVTSVLLRELAGRNVTPNLSLTRGVWPLFTGVADASLSRVTDVMPHWCFSCILPTMNTSKKKEGGGGETARSPSSVVAKKLSELSFDFRIPLEGVKWSWNYTEYLGSIAWVLSSGGSGCPWEAISLWVYKLAQGFWQAAEGLWEINGYGKNKYGYKGNYLKILSRRERIQSPSYSCSQSTISYIHPLLSSPTWTSNTFPSLPE